MEAVSWYEGVKHLIDDLALLDGTPPHAALEHVAGLLQDPARGGVSGEGMAKTLANPCWRWRSRSSPSPPESRCPAPMLRRDPVAEFRGHAFDVLVELEADAPHRFVGHRDGEAAFGSLGK